jgi:hypothetical protein
VVLRGGEGVVGGGGAGLGWHEGGGIVSVSRESPSDRPCELSRS